MDTEQEPTIQECRQFFEERRKNRKPLEPYVSPMIQEKVRQWKEEQDSVYKFFTTTK